MAMSGALIESRLAHLERHLAQENPVLLKAVQSFRELDAIAYRMGLLDKDDSYTAHIPWWPLISVLGTFSSGKSTFINDYLGEKLQRSGNQAVDDKFTVICYNHERTSNALPGVALDSDPRFPFYQISSEIDKVEKGEGDRIDAYLQLKACPSQKLRGKILIDSPGFDADAQRTSTLRITDHIINLSDLVLVFFDARHPEPGAMRDTLEHLVSDTIRRSDSGKFLYILNQIDTTAREDNPEDVIAAWQRALGERGLTAGRFYTIYNEAASVPIEDEALRNRFRGKRDADLGEIHGRMQQVEIERAYRIIAALEKMARDIEEKAVPALNQAIAQWRKRTLIADMLVFALLIGGGLVLSIKQGYWSSPPSWMQEPGTLYAAGLGVLLAAIAIHFGVRSLTAKTLVKQLRQRGEELDLRGDLVAAFGQCRRFWRSIFALSPAGWGRGSRKKLYRVIHRTDEYIQTLNDRFTNPSGEESVDQQMQKILAKNSASSNNP
ncbi:MAG: dynamin family protein [Gammaproteobacteria bacterium]|nr:dynamin family protein [Gammaproteobacteria bacterium]